jgi:polysaccharide biosynthesis transport protein
VRNRSTDNNMKEKSLLDYWIVLYKKKKEIFFIVFISVVIAIILSKVVPPIYEARSVFYIPSSSPALSYLSETSTDNLARNAKIPATKEEIFAPYIGILKSKKIAELVHKELPQKDLQKLLRNDIEFELTNEFMLVVYSRDNDPTLAADVANVYVKSLNYMLQEASLNSLGLDASVMERHVADITNRLFEAENALKNFEEKKNIASIDEEIKNLTSQRILFQSQLESTEVQIKDNEEKINSVSEQFKKEKTLYSGRDFAVTSPLIEYLQKKLSDLSVKIVATEVELKETHPDLLMLKREYAETEDKLKKEIQYFVSSQIKPENTFHEQLRQNLVNLLIDKNRLYASKNGYSEAIKRISEGLRNLPAIRTEWTRLNEGVLRYRKTYAQLKLNLEEAGMQESRQMQLVVVVDKAEPPKNPSFPILWLNVIVTLISGLIVGVFYAFFIDYIEETRKIRTKKIIKEILSIE